MTRKSNFTIWDPSMWFKFTKVTKVQLNQSISILTVLTWSLHLMTERPKFGTHKKANFNTLFKLTLITRSSVEKETTLSVEVLKRQLTSGNVDFMTRWKKKSCQVNLQSPTRTIKKKLSSTLNRPAAKLMKGQNHKENFPSLNYVWQNSKIQTGSLKMWCLTTRMRTFSWSTRIPRRNQRITLPKWETCFLRGWSQSCRKYRTRSILSQSKHLLTQNNANIVESSHKQRRAASKNRVAGRNVIFSKTISRNSFL